MPRILLSSWSRRWIVAFFCWLAASAQGKNATKQARGFLLVATHTPVLKLRTSANAHDDLGAALRDVCATGYPGHVVVRTSEEASIVRRHLPCKRVEVSILDGEEEDGRRTTAVSLRYFKVGALASALPLFEGGTLYLDNDIAIRRDGVDELFGYMDEARRRHKSLGLTPSHICIPPGHSTKEVPKGFCERQGGVIFFADGRRSKAIVQEWLKELQRHTSSDGHDQMPLRKVLWKHHDELLDVPSDIQCRSKHHGDPCKRSTSGRHAYPLLWHSHHEERLKWTKTHRRSGITNGTTCGFVA